MPAPGQCHALKPPGKAGDGLECTGDSTSDSGRQAPLTPLDRHKKSGHRRTESGALACLPSIVGPKLYSARPPEQDLTMTMIADGINTNNTASTCARLDIRTEAYAE